MTGHSNRPAGRDKGKIGRRRRPGVRRNRRIYCLSPPAGAVGWVGRRRYTYYAAGPAAGQAKAVYREWTDAQGTHSVRDSLTAYNPAGRVSAVTDANGRVTQTHYDAAGQVSYIVDAFGGRTATAYDRRGQAIRTVYPDGTENPSRHLCD